MTQPRLPPDGWTSKGPPHGEKAKYGLALSGGGYRAMLFHLGALYRLNELGLLGPAGSGVIGLRRVVRRLRPGARVAQPRIRERAVRSFRQARCGADRAAGEHAARRPDRGARALPFVNPTSILRFALDRILLHGLRLDQLPDVPRFTFNAAHLATGTNWRFAKPYMGTYRVGLIPTPTTPVAVAAAASASFPPIVSPLVLRTDPAAFVAVEGSDLYPDERLRRDVLLLDGGAYDNLGVEAIDDRSETLLVSDGGGNLGVDTGHGKFVLWALQLRRVLDMSVEQGRDLRRHELYSARRPATSTWRCGGP